MKCSWIMSLDLKHTEASLCRIRLIRYAYKSLRYLYIHLKIWQFLCSQQYNWLHYLLAHAHASDSSTKCTCTHRCSTHSHVHVCMYIVHILPIAGAYTISHSANILIHICTHLNTHIIEVLPGTHVDKGSGAFGWEHQHLPLFNQLKNANILPEWAARTVPQVLFGYHLPWETSPVGW